MGFCILKMPMFESVINRFISCDGCGVFEKVKDRGVQPTINFKPETGSIVIPDSPIGYTLSENSYALYFSYLLGFKIQFIPSKTGYEYVFHPTDFSDL